MSASSDKLTGYVTVSRPAAVETVINRSRFIGAAWPVASEDEARDILADTRRRYHDATHNCYAYSVERGAVCRFSDDGEPGGTAGLPMMETVKRKGVTDTLVIVTRYFGGILLGAGGLVRAYSASAAGAVDAAGPVEIKVGRQLAVTLDYGRFSAAEGYLRALGAEDIEFTHEVTARLTVEDCDADGVIARLVQMTDGRAAIAELGRAYMKKPIPEGDMK